MADPLRALTAPRPPLPISRPSLPRRLMVRLADSDSVNRGSNPRRGIHPSRFALASQPRLDWPKPSSGGGAPSCACVFRSSGCSACCFRRPPRPTSRCATCPIPQQSRTCSSSPTGSAGSEPRRGPGELLIMRDGVTYVVTPGEQVPTGLAPRRFPGRRHRGGERVPAQGHPDDARRRPNSHYRLSRTAAPDTSASGPAHGSTIEEVALAPSAVRSPNGWLERSRLGRGAGGSRTGSLKPKSRIFATVFYNPGQLFAC